MEDIKQFIIDNSVDQGFLSDWYQTSVSNEPPIWTDEHISEVYGDFYMIPKEVVDKDSIKTVKTEKYNHMISSFQCDFSLAKEDEDQLSSLDTGIREKDERLMKDIELLEELEFLLRSGQAEIRIVKKYREE